MSESLGDAIPKEQARVRELIALYRATGPAGAFAVAFMEADLRRMDAAVASGDLPAMIAAYQSLKEYKE